MDADAVRWYGRQLALAEFGPDAQAAVLEACVVVVGDGLVAETCARYLAAAGVRRLALEESLATKPGLREALGSSNPHLLLAAVTTDENERLANASLLVKEGFDDDPWLGAAIRRGCPAIFARAFRDENRDVVELLSLRRQGPCPHHPLDRPTQTDRTSGKRADAGAAATVAGTLAAAEALRLLGARGRGEPDSSPARHLRLTLGGTVAPRVQDIPWSPACFACGGQGTEASFI